METNNVLSANFFKVNTQDKLMGIFQKASGGNFEVKKIPYKFTGNSGKPENHFSHGAPEYTDLVLERAVMKDGRTEMQAWLKEVHNGDMNARKNMTLTLCDINGDSIVAIDYIDAYPIKCEFSGIDANGATLITEKITIAYRYMEYKSA
jgi:phage tail-like protein